MRVSICRQHAFDRQERDSFATYLLSASLFDFGFLLSGWLVPAADFLQLFVADKGAFASEDEVLTFLTAAGDALAERFVAATGAAASSAFRFPLATAEEGPAAGFAAFTGGRGAGGPCLFFARRPMV